VDSKVEIAVVYCISNCKSKLSLMALSSESHDVVKSHWMSPGFEEGFAFLLVHTEVGALHGVVLAAEMPLVVEEEALRS
jgi:hypothetical protein